MKIAVMGLGAVALADALGLARGHEVTITGQPGPRFDAVASGRYPIDDPALAGYLSAHRLTLRAEADPARALTGAEVVLVGVPLAIDPVQGRADTAELDADIALAVRHAPGAIIAVRSAVPVGHTARLRAAHPGADILVAPEFSEPETPLSDILAPSLILVGDRGESGARLASVLASAALAPGFAIRQTGAPEAEAARHLSLILQAARITYFNELDSYALAKDLDARSIIEGVCLDPRVGTHQANPCFGPGGPLLALAEAAVADLAGDLPLHLLPNTARARDVRLDFLQDRINATKPRRVYFAPDGAAASPRSTLALLRQRLAAAGLDIRDTPAERGSTGGPEDEGPADGDLVIARTMTPRLSALRGPVFSRDHFPRV